MSILQSLRSAASHAGHVRSVMKSNVQVSLRRNYTAAPDKTPAPAADEGGSNPLLWIGCLSLGVAYTYYEKKQKEKLAIIEAATHEEVSDSVKAEEEVSETK